MVVGNRVGYELYEFVICDLYNCVNCLLIYVLFKFYIIWLGNRYLVISVVM